MTAALSAVAPREPGLVSAAIVSAYDVLAAIVAEGRAIDATVLSTLEASLRQRRGKQSVNRHDSTPSVKNPCGSHYR